MGQAKGRRRMKKAVPATDRERRRRGKGARGREDGFAPYYGGRSSKRKRGTLGLRVFGHIAVGLAQGKPPRLFEIAAQPFRHSQYLPPNLPGLPLDSNSWAPVGPAVTHSTHTLTQEE